MRVLALLPVLTLLLLCCPACPEPLESIADAGPRNVDEPLPVVGADAGPAWQVDSGTADAGAPASDDAGAPDAPDAGSLPPLGDTGAPGPYLVGVRTVELYDATRDRSMLVDLWYPIDPAAPTAGSDNAYSIEMPLVGEVGHIESPARRDAPPLSGTWPLVVFSHGYGGIRFQSIFLTEHLASWGIVVAAPDHPGNTLTEPLALGSDEARAQSAQDRPLDVIAVLDRMLVDGLGAGITVDPARVAVSGHSFGGWTALEVARRDARFSVVFPMAPGFRDGSTPDFVATLARPLLIVGGSLDDTCEFDEGQLAPYELAQTPKHLLEVIGAGHLDFSNLCEVALARAFVDDGCNEDNIDPAVVHARVRTVATAFALRYLLGDLRAEPALANASALPDVVWWRAP